MENNIKFEVAINFKDPVKQEDILIIRDQLLHIIKNNDELIGVQDFNYPKEISIKIL